MKATLLIKNIENCYTCDAGFTIVKQAFIALHHDKIIKVGTGDYRPYIEETTRVIDAVGEIAVPAFVDCDFRSFQHVRLGDRLRENRAALFAMRQNGILTLLTEDKSAQRKELTQDVFLKTQKSSLPIVEKDRQYIGLQSERFLLSCGFGIPNRYVYSLQPLCYSLFNNHQVPAKTLLEGMTSLPCQEYGLDDRGRIEEGMLGDLLILQVPTIEHYFQTLGRPLIHRMIKNGIPFYPKWMVC